jgi:hypothetical protein
MPVKMGKNKNRFSLRAKAVFLWNSIYTNSYWLLTIVGRGLYYP